MPKKATPDASPVAQFEQSLDELEQLVEKMEQGEMSLEDSLAAYERAGKDSGAKAEAVAKLRAVTQMFEAARAGPSTTPEWGAADAYAFLGRVLLEQRDVVGAREALERALLIAPDYAMVRQLMSQITR